jgi:rare lipoprotein A
MRWRLEVLASVALCFACSCADAIAQNGPTENNGFSSRFYFDEGAGERPPATLPANKTPALRDLLIAPAEAAPQSADQPAQGENRQASEPASPAAEPNVGAAEKKGPAENNAPTATTGQVAAEKQPPAPRKRLVAKGRASYYKHPGRTASGETYNPDGLTAAHRNLPLGKRLEVVNLRTGRSVVVRVNDRMPPKAKFVIDLSRGSARAIGMNDVAPVALYALD